MIVEIQLKVILHMLGDEGIHSFAISLMLSKISLLKLPIFNNGNGQIQSMKNSSTALYMQV